MCVSDAAFPCTTESEVSVLSLFEFKLPARDLLAKPLFTWSLFSEALTCGALSLSLRWAPILMFFCSRLHCHLWGRSVFFCVLVILPRSRICWRRLTVRYDFLWLQITEIGTSKVQYSLLLFVRDERTVQCMKSIVEAHSIWIGQLVDAFVLDSKSKRMCDDGDVIADAVPMVSSSYSAPDCPPSEFVSVSKDVVTFIAEQRVCRAGLLFWFLLLVVFVECFYWRFSCRVRKYIAWKAKSKRLPVFHENQRTLYSAWWTCLVFL